MTVWERVQQVVAVIYLIGVTWYLVNRIGNLFLHISNFPNSNSLIVQAITDIVIAIIAIILTINWLRRRKRKHD